MTTTEKYSAPCHTYGQLHRSDVNFEQIDIALSHVTNHAITVEPHNTTWLHTQGDLYLDSRNYSAALKCYLKAGSISSLSFNQPVPPTVWDTQVFKKMVICCMSLKAHIQAALLCQCVDPVDFMTAFKAFQLAVVSRYPCKAGPTG
ncbi:integrator complex subunit 8-like [Nematostella vectensis]|uniref:integrator complex subunit 8-like n=1 Tax=Nematostella vectensis TaxID=45351 RepID=UPI0020775C3F|nr:integrator complex subunit 8-like [Nematostella vectensis]